MEYEIVIDDCATGRPGVYWKFQTDDLLGYLYHANFESLITPEIRMIIRCPTMRRGPPPLREDLASWGPWGPPRKKILG